MSIKTATWMRLIFFIILLFSISFLTAQSKTIQALKENKMLKRGYYFYPSTLRMLNLDNNEDFNHLVRNLKKIVVFPGDSAYTKIKVDDTRRDLQQEGYEEYLTIDEKNSNIILLGRKPEEMVLLITNKNNCYIAEVLGEIDLLEVPKLFNALSSGELNPGNDFINVFDIMNNRHNNNQREAENEEVPVDSLGQNPN